MSKNEILKKLYANRSKMKQFGVRKIGLFGSYAKGKPREKSDIDVLVEFKEKTFDNYMNLKFFLERLLKAKVDLVIYDALKPQLKPLIMNEVIYAKEL